MGKLKNFDTPPGTTYSALGCVKFPMGGGTVRNVLCAPPVAPRLQLAMNTSRMQSGSMRFVVLMMLGSSHFNIESVYQIPFFCLSLCIVI